MYVHGSISQGSAAMLRIPGLLCLVYFALTQLRGPGTLTRPMDTTQLAAAVTLLQSATSVAIFPVAADDVDAVAASLAIALVLRSRGAVIQIFPGGEPAPAVHSLAGTELFADPFAPAAELTITVPTTKTPLAQLTYDRTPAALKVHVTARSGAWSTRDVDVRSGWQSSSDVMLVIGAARLAALSQRFTAHADLFYQTPLITIANQPDAERFGQANVIDRSARSCTELVTALIRTWDTTLLTAPVATALYAGLMAATESWQKSMTSPAQFELGAALLEAGADRLGVVRHFYKTKPLAHLKLWGRLLSRVTTTLASDGTRVAHANLTREDLERSGAGLEAVQELLTNVLVHAPDVDVVGVLSELGPAQHAAGSTPRVAIFVASARGEALTIARRLGPTTGTRNVARVDAVAVSLEQARQELLRACDSAGRPGYTGGTRINGGPKGGQPQRTSHPQELSSRQTR